jgi:hypothetical protein
LSSSKDVSLVALLPLPFPYLISLLRACHYPSNFPSTHDPFSLRRFHPTDSPFNSRTQDQCRRFVFRVPVVTIVKGETLVEITDRPAPCYAMPKSNVPLSAHHNAPTTIKPTAPNMAPNPTSILLDPPVCKLPPLPLVVAGPDPPVV